MTAGGARGRPCAPCCPQRCRLVPDRPGLPVRVADLAVPVREALDLLRRAAGPRRTRGKPCCRCLETPRTTPPRHVEARRDATAAPAATALPPTRRPRSTAATSRPGRRREAAPRMFREEGASKMNTTPVHFRNCSAFAHPMPRTTALGRERCKKERVSPLQSPPLGSFLGVRHMRSADARHRASVRAIFMRECLPMRQFRAFLRHCMHASCAHARKMRRRNLRKQ